MKIKKTIMQATEITQTKICDMCGATSERLSAGYFSYHPYIHSFAIEPGFGSKFDGQRIKFELCDSCLGLVLGSMSIPPKSDEVE